MMQTETLAAVRGAAKWELIAAVVTEVLNCRQNTLCVFVGTGFSHFSVRLLGAQSCCYLSQTCQIHNLLLQSSALQTQISHSPI